MRHNVVNNKFRMKTSHRIATFRNMTVSLIENGKIETTLDKAKVLRGVIEPLITLAKRGDVAARRLALKKLPNAESVRKLFHEIAPVFKDRNGGYTRVLKLGRRKGDNAEMALRVSSLLPFSVFRTISSIAEKPATESFSFIP